MLEVPRHAGCPFCEYLDGSRPCAFVFRGDTVSTFLNRTQYERGALLVVPNEHRETILDLDSDLLARVYSEAQRVAGGVVAAFGAVGVNIFHNSGVRAGQTISHFHVHVVPRYGSSEPWRNFRAEEFDHMPVDQLEEIAVPLRVALNGGHRSKPGSRKSDEERR